MAYATSTYAALALAAAAAGAQYYNTTNTARKQDNALAAQLQQQAKNQDRADNQVQQLITQRATSDAAGERQSTLDQYLTQARASNGNATRGLGQVGATSDAYRSSAADAALGVGDYGARLSSLMSRVDAPAQQRQREAIENAQFQTNLGLLGREARGDDFLAQLRLRGINRNPWVDAASTLMGGAAGAAAMSGAGSAAAAGAGGSSGWGAFGPGSSSWLGVV